MSDLVKRLHDLAACKHIAYRSKQKVETPIFSRERSLPLLTKNPKRKAVKPVRGVGHEIIIS